MCPCLESSRMPQLTDTDYPGAQGRTLTDVIGSNPSQDDYDGLNESLIKRALEAAQTLHSVLHPITPDRDIRHNEEEKYMVYSPDGGSSEISDLSSRLCARLNILILHAASLNFATMTPRTSNAQRLWVHITPLSLMSLRGVDLPLDTLLVNFNKIWP
ncbi:hypothetical protein B0H14DRAFT_3138294, partial [Mycena olivaceomarginata]